MTKAINDLSPEYIKLILEYHPDTGKLLWKPRIGNDNQTNAWNARYAGIEAGYVFGGYRTIRIRNPETGKERGYRAHRLAHVIMRGEWPEHLIDHEDGNGLNNRWVNIQPATNAQNLRKQQKRSNNTSGFKGVSWNKATKKWIVYGTNPKTGKNKYLGRFTDKIEAAQAYDAFVLQHYGDFARPNFPASN